MNNILMNKNMTKAILDSRKVQTRRVVSSRFSIGGMKKVLFGTGENDFSIDMKYYDNKEKEAYKIAPEAFTSLYAKYHKGETIWVREPARVVKHTVDCNGEWFGTIIEYLADGKQVDFDFHEKHAEKKWFQKCQGIPNGCIKEMARIFLKITNVRVERLKDISEEDALFEGVEYREDYIYQVVWRSFKNYATNKFDFKQANPIKSFETLWNSTAPKGSKWEDNPYVFVYEFERVEL